MLRGNLDNPLLQENESKEDPSVETSILVRNLSDEEKYETLSFIKDFLLDSGNFDPTHSYGESEHPGVIPVCGYKSDTALLTCLQNVSCTGLFVTTVGMCFLALNTIPYLFFDEDKQPFGAYSIWLGVTGAGAGLALLPCLSYQAVYACQKEEKPVRIFDEDKLGDLNSRLNKLDLDFIHHQTTSKELNILYKKTDKALSDTIAGFIQFGKTVKSALPARGFFSQRNRLVLEYLMPDKKILDLVAPETRKFKQNHL